MHSCLGEVWTNYGIRDDLNALPLSKEANAMVVVLGEAGEEKLQQLTSVMASSKTSGKSIYVSWIRYFDEGEGTQGGCVLGCPGSIVERAK